MRAFSVIINNKPISKMLKLTLTCFIFCLVSFKSHAVVTITVNIPAKTLDIAGSITGTAGFKSNGGHYGFEYDVGGDGSVSGGGVVDMESFTVSSPDNSFFFAKFQAIYYTITDRAILQVFWGSDPVAEQNVTISGPIGLSYSGWSANAQTALETLASADTVAPAIIGTTSDTVLVTTVPEPSTYAAICGLSCLAIICLRKSRYYSSNA